MGAAQTNNVSQPTRDTMSFEEATISNMWEIALPGQDKLTPFNRFCSSVKVRFEWTSQSELFRAGFHLSTKSQVPRQMNQQTHLDTLLFRGLTKNGRWAVS